MGDELEESITCSGVRTGGLRGCRRHPPVRESSRPPVHVSAFAVLFSRMLRLNRIVGHRGWYDFDIATLLYEGGKVRRGGYWGHPTARELDGVSAGDIPRCIMWDTMRL